MTPYSYRHLSPEERREILSNRQKSGLPLHSPPHPILQAGYYLITAANYQHKPVMTTPERRCAFEITLLQSIRKVCNEIVAWVVLPNHYHVLAGIDNLKLISPVLKQLHGATSREWNLADNMTSSRKVWYKWADQWIRDEEHYWRVINYIHVNPLKHGLVEDVYQWEWSSLPTYYQEYGREWLREKWSHYSPGNFGEGWD